MTLENWRRNYNEEDNREVKYSWINTQNEHYRLEVIDTEKVFGRFSEEYDEGNRYVIELIYIPNLDFESQADVFEVERTKTVTEAYNNSTDIGRNYPDAKDLEQDLTNNIQVAN